MATFAILADKELKRAANGYAKKVGTFAELTHQLAYSALNHVELHNDACYVNTIYNATPTNSRKAVQVWFTNFGRVKFDAKALTFTYDKKGESDLTGAMAIGPLEFSKAKGEKKAADSFEEATFKKATKIIENVESSDEDRRFARHALALINSLRSNVVELKQAA